MSGYDPIVARALDQLVAGIESDPDETLRRARVAAQGLKRRRATRVRRTAILALAALVLLIGAAVAGARSDLLPWFGDDSTRAVATFSVDYSRTSRGPAPDALLCPDPGPGSLNCSVYPGPAPDRLLCPDAGPGSFNCPEARLPSSARPTYLVAMRVEPRDVTFSRDLILRGLAASEKNGRIEHATAERIRRELAAVSDDFISAWGLLMSVQSVHGSNPVPERPGFELVPPSGVPMWIACRTSGGGFSCHDLASSENVAVGTPLYELRATPDWIVVREKWPGPADGNRLFQAVLGRDPTPAEARLLLDWISTGTLEP